MNINQLDHKNSGQPEDEGIGKFSQDLDRLYGAQSENIKDVAMPEKKPTSLVGGFNKDLHRRYG